MRNLFKLLTGLSILLLVCGCKKEEPVPPLGNLMVIARDAVSGSLLTDVSAVLMNIEKVAEVTPEGVVFKDVKPGKYVVKVEKEGYAGVYVDAILEMEAGSDKAFAYNSTVFAEMKKLGTKISGKVYSYADGIETIQRLPVNNAVLKIHLVDQYIQNEYIATTKEDGSYCFENLPENSRLFIQPQDITLNNLIYSAHTIDKYSKASGEELTGVNITYTILNSLLEFVYIPQRLETDQDIIFKFNDSIDISRIEDGSIYIIGSNPRIEIDYIWSDNNQTLTIRGATSEASTSDRYIEVYFPTLYSISGKTATNPSFRIKIKAMPTQE